MADIEGLWDELNRGAVYECSLRDPKWHLDGLQSDGAVFIDPRTSILETLLHELLHRRHPRMREQAVTREARRLLGGMDESTKATWWRQYLKVRRKRRPVDVED
jgi:hypothetical protein